MSKINTKEDSSPKASQLHSAKYLKPRYNLANEKRSNTPFQNESTKTMKLQSQSKKPKIKTKRTIQYKSTYSQDEPIEAPKKSKTKSKSKSKSKTKNKSS